MKFILLFLIAVSFQAHARDMLSLTLEEFYLIEENQKIYEALLNSGQIDKTREMYKSVCLNKAQNDEDKNKCNCAAQIIAKADGKMLVYDSVMAYKSFEAKVEAKKAGNEQEYQRLNDLDSKRKGLSRLIEAECN